MLRRRTRTASAPTLRPESTPTFRNNDKDLEPAMKIYRSAYRSLVEFNILLRMNFGLSLNIECVPYAPAAYLGVSRRYRYRAQHPPAHIAEMRRYSYSMIDCWPAIVTLSKVLTTRRDGYSDNLLSASLNWPSPPMSQQLLSAVILEYSMSANDLSMCLESRKLEPRICSPP
ncbi:hypothetical protein BDN70DRAFT_509567 [Pholiota conissans]|uniref:Uncharacterized protein n=1 Tax=Pholiota conissans TaxID=109636 RepID=A0A9P6CTX3_9AGAR|nr:hypothetical protein BDN70DRAFT_509567 [Pholiota conissans]